MNYALISNGTWYYFDNTTALFRAWQGLGGSMWKVINGVLYRLGV